MPRFVLLYHDSPPSYMRPSHWDLMLEVGDTLHTWSLPELPRAWHVVQSATAALFPACPASSSGNIVDAEQLGHHRHAYLEFEGPLSGDRGQVCRIVSGTYVTKMKSSHELRLMLDGGSLRSEIAMYQNPGDSEKWVLRCES